MLAVDRSVKNKKVLELLERGLECNTGLQIILLSARLAMPLPSLTVLTFTSSAPNAIPRVVDIGLSLSAPADAPPHGAYAQQFLAPSPRVETWWRDGAHFSMSLMGAIRVWHRTRLLASECVFDREAHGAAPLAAEDIAYLEAYLLFQDQAQRVAHLRLVDDARPAGSP